MRIAIPSSEDSHESLISNNLGRSPFIGIYDEETKCYDFFENPGYKIQDGSGLKAAEIIIQNKADVLLTMEIGQKAYSVLVKEHIDIHFLSSGGIVKSTINKFLK
jgi:predicted Fe-Mo cluster-binding NifX family protein